MSWARPGSTLRTRAAALMAGHGDDLADDPGQDLTSSLRRRRHALRVLLLAVILVPAAIAVSKQGLSGRTAFVAPAAVVFAVLVDRVALTGTPPARVPPRWVLALLPVILALAAALDVVGRGGWLVAVSIAAAAAGRHLSARRLAGFAIACCAALSVGVGLWRHEAGGALFGDLTLPLLAGFLSYTSQRRNLLIVRLNETRAELARMAVAQERLRIARDLHDLLGHSLSLITLKAELASRLLESDHAGAAREIAELEGVARRSLTEVREAVTAYRQPSLVSELAAARRLLTAAGVDCRIGQRPDQASLPASVDALLAWTVREGATKIVRHSRARTAWITVEVTPGAAIVELADDGSGPPARLGTTAPAGGSGLAGLSERAARLDGRLEAGESPAGGFRLRVSVPLARTGPDAPASPASHPTGQPA